MEEQTFLVWGCGPWMKRRMVVPEGEPMECVTEDMLEDDLLPLDFLEEWGRELGSQHWAELVCATEDNMHRAVSGEDSVYGWREIYGPWETLMETIASGRQDIDLIDFQDRMGRKEGWDWGDMEAECPDPHRRTRLVREAITIGLRKGKD